MIPGRSAAFLLIALAACAPRAEPPQAATGAPRSPEPPPSAEAPEAEAADAGSEDQALLTETLARVARVRELEARRTVKGKRLNREQLRAWLEHELAEEAPPELVEGNRDLMFALDLVTERFDLRRTITQLYSSQVAGLYDPRADQMILASDLGDEELKVTLYHELVHALQDQHYDLDQAHHWRPEETDAQAALQALAEGDATAAMLQVASGGRPLAETQLAEKALSMQAMLLQASPELGEVPGVLIRGMVAPYVDGLAFVRFLRERGGWAAVDRAWRERPVSTEQVLHPEKYLAHEAVAPVAPIAVPPGFGKATYRDVMGEQGLRLLFEEWTSVTEAAQAASGWGGDRLALFADGSRRMLRWHLVFDDPVQAERAFVALASGALRSELDDVAPEGLRPQVPLEQARRSARGDRLCQARPRRGPFAMARRGRQIGVTLGPYQRDGQQSRSTGSCASALSLADSLMGQ